ncbi:hypothetical protein [Thalassotalea sp. PLHSN55]
MSAFARILGSYAKHRLANMSLLVCKITRAIAGNFICSIELILGQANRH